VRFILFLKINKITQRSSVFGLSSSVSLASSVELVELEDFSFFYGWGVFYTFLGLLMAFTFEYSFCMASILGMISSTRKTGSS
jgi:hypothetical protein